MKALVIALVVVVVSACADPVCDDAPVESFATFGDGFLRANCQGCHASSSTRRQGAPDDVVFDTEDDVRVHKDRVLARVDEQTMPPAGGLVDDDVTRLKIWLTCNPP